MRKLLLLCLSVLVFNVALAGSDSLFVSRTPYSSWKPSAGAGAQISQTGYSVTTVATIRWKHWAVSSGGKIIASKTYLLSSAPYGVVTSVYYFPNGDLDRFSGFINADYQLTFQRNRGPASEFVSHHRIHEYTAGYGFTYRLNKRMELLSAINFGRYTEAMSNAWTGEREKFSGYNGLLRFGINYTIRP